MGNTVELTDSAEPRVLRDGPDPMIGRVLLHYRICERIGQGGMSVVYRGIDENLHRDVAVKVLHPFLAEKAECRARLAREARAVARLEHENILRIFDYSGAEHDDDEPVPAKDDGFLVTELVPGGTLKEYAETHEMWRLPEVGALCIWQVACALQHAHDMGVVHRDLKPENVMVRTDGVIKLMDFGIAQVVDSKSLTMTGTLLGSPAHMAPECIEGEHADEQSDVFSLGTVMYWLCTGALPFEAATPHALLKAIVEGRVPPPQQKNPRVSDDLARVLSRALRKKKKDRYASAREFADALEAVLREAGLVATPELVARTMKSPDEAFADAAERVRATCLSRAEALLAEGQKARAFSVLSRVLAEYPGDERATALLEQAEPGDDSGEWEDLPPDEHTEDGIPAVAAPAEVLTTTDVLERAAAPAASRLGLYLGIVGLLALVVAVALFVERFRDRGEGGADPVAGAVDNPEPEMNIGAPDVSRPAVDPAPAPRPAVDPRAVRRPEPKKIVRATIQPKAKPAAAVDKTQEAAPAEVATRHVAVTVNGYASVLVDGKPLHDVMRKKDIELSVGRHELRFENQAAIAQTLTLDVPADGPVKPIVVQLKPKPALLTVRTPGLSGDVFVRSLSPGAGQGRIVGTTQESVARPIPVFFSSRRGHVLRGTERFEVTVTAPGHAPFVQDVTLTAGKLKTIDATLAKR